MQLLLFPSFRAEFSVSKVIENEFVFGQTGFVVETAHQVEPARKERFGVRNVNGSSEKGSRVGTFSKLEKPHSQQLF